jgi:hypothetical protein
LNRTIPWFYGNACPNDSEYKHNPILVELGGIAPVNHWTVWSTIFERLYNYAMNEFNAYQVRGVSYYER